MVTSSRAFRFVGIGPLIGKSRGRQGTTKDTNLAKKDDDRRAFCAPCGRTSSLKTRSDWKCPEYPGNRFVNAESFLDGSP
jgi:inner membrane protein involved in colicin E2 resistance